ncbi:MAG TPA: hypothetical protein VFZ83_02200 [Acidimicrobiia bacterium]|nr:hypothetical protein [Acidimicrobiia bacterium]
MEPRTLGSIGSRVVFENDRVRIWVLSLAPGATSATHRHDLPHVLVQIAGDRIAVEPEPDSAGPFREYLEADVVAGMATYVEAGGIETARNVGSEPYREVIIELKDGAA